MKKIQRSNTETLRGFLSIRRVELANIITRGAIVALVAVWAIGASAAPYRITDLGTLGGTSSGAFGINASGQAVGLSNTANGGATHAFLYSSGTMSDLGTLGGTFSNAQGINARGQVVGVAATVNPATAHAFLYSNGTMMDLGTLGGANSSAYDINAKEQVVGVSDIVTGSVEHAFLYQDGAMRDLGTLGGTSSGAFGINVGGQVVGYANTANDAASRAFLYSKGKMSDLGTLGGTFSNAFGINASGHVVGRASTANNAATHAFLYSKGKMSDLGTLAGTFASEGVDINVSGQVVGDALLIFPDGETIAFVYSNGKMMELRSLLPANSGWSRLDFAYAINNKGQIAGGGTTTSGARHAFLMTPNFPESLVLDSFDRHNGKLEPNWSGDADHQSYKIKNDQVEVGDGGKVYWQAGAFGTSQEAFVTLTKIDPNGAKQGLLLKAQGAGPMATPHHIHGGIGVTYNAKAGAVQVRAFLPRAKNWKSYPDLAVKLQDGDQLGAQVHSNGNVDIFRNHLPIGTLALNAADQAFFNHNGGRIGLQFDGSADDAIFDDFGGGTITTLSGASGFDPDAEHGIAGRLLARPSAAALQQRACVVDHRSAKTFAQQIWACGFK